MTTHGQLGVYKRAYCTRKIIAFASDENVSLAEGICYYAKAVLRADHSGHSHQAEAQYYARLRIHDQGKQSNLPLPSHKYPLLHRKTFSSRTNHYAILPRR